MNSTDLFYLKMVLADPNTNVSYLTVIEPFDYDMARRQVKLKEFAFVFGSTLKSERDKIEQLLVQCYKSRKNETFSKYFHNQLKTKINKILKKPDINSDESVFNDTISVFFDIAYYSACFRNKDTHFRKFFALSSNRDFYYCFLSSIDMPSMEVLKKIEEKFNWMQTRKLGTSNFVLSVSRNIN